MSTCVLFLLPFATAFRLLEKPNSQLRRGNAWINFWQLNNNFRCKSELHGPSNWIDQATPVGNNTENTITIWISELGSLPYDMFPYYPSPYEILLHQCCTQNGKRSIKGSLLTSRFCKCYGVVNNSRPSFVFNFSCNSNVNWLHRRKNESKWKCFQRKTALDNKKKRNTPCLKHKLFFNCPAKRY